MFEVDVIGIHAKFEHGKDALAERLRNAFEKRGTNVVFRSWADDLKDEVSTFLASTQRLYVAKFLEDKNCTYTDEIMDDLYGNELNPFVGDKDFVLDLCYSAEKKPRVRRILQGWGTEYRRQQTDPDYWVKRLAAYISSLPPKTKLIIADTRYPNEAAQIREWGGVLLKVERPGHVPSKPEYAGHISETALSAWTDWNAVFINDGTLDDLAAKAEAYVAGSA